METFKIIKKHFKAQAKTALYKCKIIDNNDGTVDIIGDLTVKFPFKYLPKIRIVTGDFNCSFNSHLKSLKGSPITVAGSFNCTFCKSLLALKGAPNTIGHSFYCNNCDSLKTLEGAPQIIKCYFNCSYCDSLTTLKNASHIGNCVFNGCKKLSEKEKSKWFKNLEVYKKRIALETSSTNQAESIWNHLK